MKDISTRLARIEALLEVVGSSLVNTSFEISAIQRAHKYPSERPFIERHEDLDTCPLVTIAISQMVLRTYADCIRMGITLKTDTDTMSMQIWENPKIAEARNIHDYVNRHGNCDTDVWNGIVVSEFYRRVALGLDPFKEPEAEDTELAPV